MDGEQVFGYLWTALAFVAGVSLLVFTEPITAWSARRAQAKCERYADRPRILRPQSANARPTLWKTRLTGVGFCLLGVVGVVTIATGHTLGG